MGEIDALVAAVAERQHGVVSRAQVLELGGTGGVIERRRASGRWRSLRTGVYVVVGSADTWHRRLMAACLGTRGVASHRAAAHLWHLPGFPAGRIEVVVPRGRRVRSAGELVHQSIDLCRLVPVAREGIPVTPLARTVLDLGAVVSPDRYSAIVHRCVHERRVAWHELLGAVLSHGPRRGRDGLGRLRAVLDADLGTRPSESDLEHLLEQVLVDAGLPRPDRQVVVQDRQGRFVARVDLGYPEQCVAIEADGRAFHTSPTDFERDRSRQNALVLAGWTVLRFTWRDVLERPDAIARDVAAALRSSPNRDRKSVV